jgi:hypothetical protein
LAGGGPRAGPTMNVHNVIAATQRNCIVCTSKPTDPPREKAAKVLPWCVVRRPAHKARPRKYCHGAWSGDQRTTYCHGAWSGDQRTSEYCHGAWSGDQRTACGGHNLWCPQTCGVVPCSHPVMRQGACRTALTRAFRCKTKGAEDLRQFWEPANGLRLHLDC